MSDEPLTFNWPKLRENFNHILVTATDIVLDFYDSPDNLKKQLKKDEITLEAFTENYMHRQVAFKAVLEALIFLDVNNSLYRIEKEATNAA